MLFAVCITIFPKENSILDPRTGKFLWGYFGIEPI